MSAFLNKLVSENLINAEQVNIVLQRQRFTKKSFRDLLVELGYVKEEEVLRILSEIHNIPVVNLKEENIDHSVTECLPYQVVRRYGVFPVCKDVNFLIVAMSDVDIIALDDLAIIGNMQIKPVLSTIKEIEECTAEHYRPFDKAVAGVLKDGDDDITVEKIDNVDEDIRKERRDTVDVQEWDVESAPVVKLTNFILYQAVRKRATDIHIEPTEFYVEIRYRIDGVMVKVLKIQAGLQASLIARIKILADLDIAETKKPQDGRVRIVVNQRKIDLRISTLPTFYGEKIALRLLDKKVARTELSQIGLEKEELNLLIKSICSSQGIILVTGPTGSGKTSTLYAALSFVHKLGGKNIVTIEDPIEYLLEGINQTQVNPAKHFTFATGLRSIVRQDPNVILVGEIRDTETAKIAFQSSLTGHLVLSTLHTNSSIASITRLLDIGVEPYLIASSITLIVAQRLVRVICPECREPYSPDAKIIKQFVEGGYMDRFNIKEFYKGKGCEVCDSTGFLGRAAIFELLKINRQIRYHISRSSPEDEIFKEARGNGLKLLMESGIQKVAAGITTLEEVARVMNTIDLDSYPDFFVETSAYKDIVTGEEDFKFSGSLEKI